MDYDTIFQMDSLGTGDAGMHPTVVADREIDPESVSDLEEMLRETQNRRDKRLQTWYTRLMTRLRLQKYFHDTKIVYKSTHLFNSERRHLLHYFDETLGMNHSSHIYHTSTHARVLNAETLGVTNLENTIHNVIDIYNGETAEDYFAACETAQDKPKKHQKRSGSVAHFCAKWSKLFNRKS